MSHDPSPPTTLVEISAPLDALHEAVAAGPESGPEPGAVPEAVASRVERRPAFTFTSPEGACSCRDVPGFREAVLAAEDPRRPTPTRLGLVSPDEAAASWLERWAEDVDQVRRRIAVRRADGVEITLVATLASYGEGVPTSLAVESILPLKGGAILRSGVHPRAEVEAAIALHEATHRGHDHAYDHAHGHAHDHAADVPCFEGPADVP